MYVKDFLLKRETVHLLLYLQEDTNGGTALCLTPSIFWPSWANATTLPNNADQDTIRKLCREAKEAYEEKYGLKLAA